MLAGAVAYQIVTIYLKAVVRPDFLALPTQQIILKLGAVLVGIQDGFKPSQHVILVTGGLGDAPANIYRDTDHLQAI